MVCDSRLSQIVKIRTKNLHKIITLKIDEETSTHLIGHDKFGCPTIVPKSDIDSMIATKCLKNKMF